MSYPQIRNNIHLPLKPAKESEKEAVEGDLILMFKNLARCQSAPTVLQSKVQCTAQGQERLASLTFSPQQVLFSIKATQARHMVQH